eukprot:COSAG01_NODE_24044_length_792_cov_3.434343_1_plen_138_part_10
MQTQVGPAAAEGGVDARVQARREEFTAALKPAVALVICRQLPGEALLGLAHLLEHPFTEANAIERLAAVQDQYFNPARELFALPADGVQILLKKWYLDDTTSVTARREGDRGEVPQLPLPELHGRDVWSVRRGGVEAG